MKFCVLIIFSFSAILGASEFYSEEKKTESSFELSISTKVLSATVLAGAATWLIMRVFKRSDEVCAFCLEGFSFMDLRTVLMCNHKFHARCMADYIHAAGQFSDSLRDMLSAYFKFDSFIKKGVGTERTIALFLQKAEGLTNHRVQTVVNWLRQGAVELPAGLELPCPLCRRNILGAP